MRGVAMYDEEGSGICLPRDMMSDKIAGGYFFGGEARGSPFSLLSLARPVLSLTFPIAQSSAYHDSTFGPSALL